VPLEQLRVARKEKTIFLVEGAKNQELGFEPFIVTNVRKVSDDSNESKSAESVATAIQPGSLQPSSHKPHLLLDIYYPKFMRNDDEDAPREREWEIHIHMDTLSLNSRDKVSTESNRRVKSVSYDLLRGKLIKASAGLLRTRFKCPECENSRSVCPGCGGFSGRFSSLFCSCGWPMPCPVCIGYGVADHAKYIQDDEEELDKLWKEIDEMLAKEKRATRPKDAAKDKAKE